MKKIPTLLVLVSIFSSIGNAQEQLPTEKKVAFGPNEKMYVNKELGVYLWLSTSPEKDAPKHRLLSDSTNEYANPMFLDTEGFNTLRSPSAVDPTTRKTIYPLQDIIFEVYADGKPPITKHKFVSGNSIYRQGKLFYGNGNVTMTISATDEVSGVLNTYYSINEVNYSKKIDAINLTSEGETIVKYYSTDKVGNRENPVVKNIIIDNTAPKTEYELIGNQNDKFVSANTVIKLNSIDKLVGVKTIYYKLNNGTKRVYSTPVSVKQLGTDGTMSFYATDYLNNTEEIQVIGGNKAESTNEISSSNFEFYVDNSAPSLKFDFIGNHSKGKYNYVSSNTKLKVTAEDDKSGVDKVFYSTNSTKVDQEYSNNISFTKEGIAYVRVNAIDYVGNKSSVVTNAYFVDNTAPVSKIIILQPKHRIKDTIFITSNTKIKIVASDNASGVKDTKYTIGDKPEIIYSAPFTINENGPTKIKLRSSDNVNNIEENKVTDIYIDNTPPIIFSHFSTTDIGTKTVRDEEFTIYPSDAKLYIAATDEASGGERIEYSINGGMVKSINPISNLISGNYEIVITAYDILGNSNQDTIKFSVEK